jgi:hypothetical protein
MRRRKQRIGLPSWFEAQCSRIWALRSDSFGTGNEFRSAYLKRWSPAWDSRFREAWFANPAEATIMEVPECLIPPATPPSRCIRASRNARPEAFGSLFIGRRCPFQQLDDFSQSQAKTPSRTSTAYRAPVFHEHLAIEPTWEWSGTARGRNATTRCTSSRRSVPSTRLIERSRPSFGDPR